MPLMKCQKNGVSGYRWGSKGACYVGPGAKKRALKQGLAEVGGDSEKFKQEMSKSSLKVTEAELEKAVAEFNGEQSEFGNKFLDTAAKYISQKTRDKMSKKDFGWPEEEKYPASTEQEFKAAVHLVGKAPKDKQEMIKKNLKRIAKKNGWAIPESWQDK